MQVTVIKTTKSSYTRNIQVTYNTWRSIATTYFVVLDLYKHVHEDITYTLHM